MIDRLANLALMAGGAELVEAADFYKDLPGHADKAVMLYHKASFGIELRKISELFKY